MKTFGVCNHVHLLAKSYSGQLSDSIRDLKRHTSKKIVEQVIDGRESRREWLLNIFESAAQQHKRNNKNQLWTHENPRKIFIRTTYNHDNPVRAGLVEKPEEYVYSGAKAYAGDSFVLDVTDLTVPWITY